MTDDSSGIELNESGHPDLQISVFRNEPEFQASTHPPPPPSTERKQAEGEDKIEQIIPVPFAVVRPIRLSGPWASDILGVFLCHEKELSAKDEIAG
jgi:hypothetical protein